MTSSDESRTAPPIDPKQLATLYEAATAGPWEVGTEIDGIHAGKRTVVKAPNESTWGPIRVVTVGQTRGHHPEGEENVALIVYLVNHTPAILALTAEVERLKDEVVRWRDTALQNASVIDMLTLELVATPDSGRPRASYLPDSNPSFGTTPDSGEAE